MVYGFVLLLTEESFNRTFLVLKYGDYTPQELFVDVLIAPFWY